MYRINDIMLGEDATFNDAQKAAKWLNDHGFECEATGDAGLINYGLDADDVPREALWEQMLAEVIWADAEDAK